MPLVLLDPLFQGITSSGARKTIPGLIKASPDLTRFLVPCAGQFTVAEALVDSGVKPEAIHCSDISLFSSVLGYLADPARHPAQLGVEIADPKLKEILAPLPQATDVQLSAKIFMAIKWAQMQGDKDYYYWQRVEFADQAAHIFNAYCASLEAFKAKMSGLTYAMRDAEDHIRAFMDDPATFIWYNPPGYSGGYEKMFDPKGLWSWSEPSIPNLEPERNDKLIADLLPAAAHVLVYVTEGHAATGAGSGWANHYVTLNEKTKKRTYVLSNRDTAGTLARRKVKPPPSKLLPVYDDHEITAKSVVRMVKTDRETALYYYDLFVRELGMVDAESFYLFTVDGQVAGTCGFFLSDWRMKRKPIAYETFGLSITCKKYARIGRLLMMTITCQEFIDELCSYVSDSLLPTKITHLRTTCLTKYPEAKKNRGILKLIERERLPNGRFHLLYETAIWQRTIHQCLLEWLEKHSNQERE